MTELQHDIPPLEPAPPGDAGSPVEGPVMPHDFDPEAGPSPEPSRPPEADAPAPLVMVQYRSWFWSTTLIPPALILALAALIVTYRPPVPFDPLSDRAEPLRPVEPEAPKAPPIVLEVKTLPAPDPIAGAHAPAPETPAAAPAPVAEVAARPADAVDAEAVVSPFEPDPPAARPPVAIGFTPPGLAAKPVEPDPAAGPTPPGPDETERALEGIRREAQQKRAERNELAAARIDPGAIERQRAALAHQAQRQQVPLAAQADYERRSEFRSQVRLLLQRYGETAGPRILGLAGGSRADVSPEVEQAIAFKMRGNSRLLQADRGRRIALLRAYGVPEPVILGDLILTEVQNQSSRQGGAHRHDLAVVRAARLLLAVPLPSPAITAARATLTAGPGGLRGQQ